MKQDKLVSYPYLVKRAIKGSIEFVIILILLFYLPEIFNFFQFLYGL